MQVDLEITIHRPCSRCGIVRMIRVGRDNTCKDCRVMATPDGPVSRKWMDAAACTQVDPELFFPDASEDWQPTRAAKRICAGCPVRETCLTQTPAWDRHSISGGLTATERRRAGSAYTERRKAS